MSKRLKVLGLVGVLLASLALPVEAKTVERTCGWGCVIEMMNLEKTDVVMAHTQNLGECVYVKVSLYTIRQGTTYKIYGPTVVGTSYAQRYPKYEHHLLYSWHTYWLDIPDHGVWPYSVKMYP